MTELGRASLLLAAMALPFHLLAQNASLSVRVIDPSGSAMGQANVRVTNQQTGVTRRIETL